MTQPHDPFELSPSLNQAIQEIAAMHAPTESSNRVTTAVLNQPPVPQRSVQRSRWGRRTAMTAIAMTCVTAAVGLFLNGTPFTQIAFAEVQQELGKTHSVQYVEYMHEVDAQNEVKLLKLMLASEGLVADAQTMQLEPGELRQRIQGRVDDIQGKLTRGEPVEAARVWIQGRYLFRREQSLGIAKSVEVLDGKGGSTVLLPGMYFQRIEVMNAETGVNVYLEPDRKKCVLMKSQTTINQNSGKTTTTELGPNPASNFYLEYKNIVPEKLASLGEKTLNGKTVTGFRKVEDSRGWNFTTTYWVDSKTKLPVQIEAEMRKDGVLSGGTTLANMTFDQMCDPALFSTQPPAGYEVSESGIHSIDVSQPDENQ